MLDNPLQFAPIEVWDARPKIASGTSDIFVTKVNADGTYGWTKRIYGAGLYSADFVDADDSGNVYLEGTSSGTQVFVDDFGMADIQTVSSDPGSFVMKINADGTYAWTKWDYQPPSGLAASLLRGSTYRHIYNYSSTAIEIRPTPDDGGVYFLPCPSWQAGWCVIPPKTEIEWQFTTSGGWSTGRVEFNAGFKYAFPIGYSLGPFGGDGFTRYGEATQLYNEVGTTVAWVTFNNPAKLDVNITDYKQ